MHKLLITVICILTLALPVGASAITSDVAVKDDVPVLTDSFILRPLGIVSTVLGFTGWVISAPFQAITRPTDMHKTFKSMVINPSRFTWVDPLGYHPDRLAAEKKGEIK